MDVFVVPYVAPLSVFWVDPQMVVARAFYAGRFHSGLWYFPSGFHLLYSNRVVSWLVFRRLTSACFSSFARYFWVVGCSLCIVVYCYSSYFVIDYVVYVAVFCMFSKSCLFLHLSQSYYDRIHQWSIVCIFCCRCFVFVFSFSRTLFVLVVRRKCR